MASIEPVPRQSRLMSTMVAVGGLTAVANLAVAAKELAIARQFGVSDSVDAFVFASMLPIFASGVVGYSFNAALIPTFVDVRENQGREAAQRLVATTMVWAIVLLVAVSVILGACFPLIACFLRDSFGLAKLALTRSLFLVMLPIIVLRGSMTIYSAVLNAENRYVLAALTPAVTPCCMVLLMFCAGREIGVYSLGLGMILGMAIETGLLACGLRRAKMSIRPRWYGMDEPARRVVRQYLPMIAGSCLGSSTIVIDQSFASTLGTGSLSTLSYGSKVVGFTLGVCATAVSTAVLPHFCTLVAKGQWKEMRRALRLNLRLVIIGCVAVTTILYLGSEIIVRALFQHGAFVATNTLLVTKVQRMCLLQIPFYVAGVFVVRLISSLQANSILVWGAVLNVVVNIVLDYILMKRMGVPGIALSTTGVYIASLIYCWIALNRRLSRISADN